MEATTVIYDERGSVAWITIDRESKRNALNVSVMQELRAAFTKAKDSPVVRAVVLTGAGDKAFSAGGDLGGFTAAQSKVEQHLLRGALVDLLEEMTRLGKPIVARVNGHALAGGFGLMAACDIIIAADHATFGMPEINTGLWPFIITAVVRTAMSERKALELMMTGRRIDAGEATALGLLNEVVPASDLDGAVERMCEALTSKSALTMRLGKDSFYATRGMGFREAMDHLHGQLAVCLESEDVIEGVTAFLEKRAPKWKDR